MRRRRLLHILGRVLVVVLSGRLPGLTAYEKEFPSAHQCRNCRCSHARLKKQFKTLRLKASSGSVSDILKVFRNEAKMPYQQEWPPSAGEGRAASEVSESETISACKVPSLAMQRSWSKRNPLEYKRILAMGWSASITYYRCPAHSGGMG
jgi:hypothetical protein